MRFVIDLDGTICSLKKDGQDYAEVTPLPGAIEQLQALKSAGHYIIIQTARHMKTCAGDVDKVIAKIGPVTLDWLKRYAVPYDEIHFGKPYGHVYIDDLAKTFQGWSTVTLSDYETQRINIVIPMAGAGSRFQAAGFTDPKPLIKAHGKTLIEWAMQSFAFLPSTVQRQLIFIVLREHVEQYRIDTVLKELFGTDCIVLVVPTVTAGQAATCLVAKTYINNYQPLYIYNCDTFATTDIATVIQADPTAEGVIPCFQSDDQRYSYVAIDQWGYATQVVEKQVVSPHATIGMYYFKYGRDFVWAAEDMIQAGAKTNQEYYVAECYNRLIALGRRVRIAQVKESWVLGTPEELKVFMNNYHEASVA